MIKQNHLTKAPFDPTPFEKSADEILKKMSVREKVGQLHLHDLGSTDEVANWDKSHESAQGGIFDKIRRGEIGSFLCRDREVTNELQRIAVEESRLGIPLLFGYDVIHGHRTVFPIPLGSAATWDPDLLEKAESVAAREAYEDGINWVCAPMIDLCRDPRWGRVLEGAGEDPFLGSIIAQAKVRGIQAVNPDTGYPYVGACFKHYCAYGAPVGGRDYEEADISERTLFMDYMKPYEAAIDAGAMIAMSSYNSVNGEAVSGSSYYLRDVLRDKFGFRGMVVSDAESVSDLVNHGVAADNKDAAAIAVTAGVDMDMIAGVYDAYLADICEKDPAVANAVNEAVRRVLILKFALGLFDHPYRESKGFTLCDESRDLARRVARNAVVLLENKNGTLPLSKNKKYFLTGPLSHREYHMIGAWAEYLSESGVYTVKKTMEEAGLDFIHHGGCPIENGATDATDYDITYKEYVKMAEECDEIIFVCGEHSDWSGESACRDDITLPKIQLEYLKALKSTGKKVSTVLMCGRPIACGNIAELSDALLLAFYSGIESGHAVCDCLFGDVNPSGRLPITIPRSTGQIPIYYSRLHCGKLRESRQNYVGVDHTPLYPFGYGLSYSDVKFSDVSVENPVFSENDTIRIHVKLENLSDIPVRETVQAYFKDDVSSVATPERKLCGFVKVDLAPREVTDVTLEIPVSRFALMTRDLREVVEPGEFTIYVGQDCTCTDCCKVTVM